MGKADEEGSAKDLKRKHCRKQHCRIGVAVRNLSALTDRQQQKQNYTLHISVLSQLGQKPVVLLAQL